MYMYIFAFRLNISYSEMLGIVGQASANVRRCAQELQLVAG